MELYGNSCLNKVKSWYKIIAGGFSVQKGFDLPVFHTLAQLHQLKTITCSQ